MDQRRSEGAMFEFFWNCDGFLVCWKLSQFWIGKTLPGQKTKNSFWSANFVSLPFATMTIFSLRSAQFWELCRLKLETNFRTHFRMHTALLSSYSRLATKEKKNKTNQNNQITKSCISFSYSFPLESSHSSKIFR